MKKLFVLVAFVTMAATTANAQWDLDNYQKSVQLGYTVGFGDNYGRVNLRTVHGLRFNEYFFAGVGAGFDIYHGVHQVDISGLALTSKAKVTLPLYVNAIGYYPVAENFEIFMGIEIGGSIGLSGKKDNTTGATMGGFLFMPEWGISYRLYNGNAVTFGFGVSVTNARSYAKTAGIVAKDSFSNSGFSLRVGYVF